MQWFSKKQSSFEDMASRAEKQVYRTCLHMMGNAADAEDCAQETMLKAYRAFDSFRGDASFATWITRIAINVCKDALRKRREVVSLEALREEKGFDPPDGQKSAYTRLEEKERLHLLRQGLLQMPSEARQLIVLRDFRNLSYEEIAQTLQLPIGTVKSRISRAREKLVQYLKNHSELFSSDSVQRNERR